MSAENGMRVRPYQPPDRAAVIRLWHDCGLVRPWNDPEADIDLKMEAQPDLFLVGEMDGRVVASTMAGYDGHRGWLYSVAVSPSCRKRGFGRQIVMAAVEKLRALGCRKVNLQVRASNLEVVAFYERIGFRSDDVIGLGMRLIDSRWSHNGDSAE
jgi:ribosomal protein S18 acetylase RimI-like enzyme